jgi:hypothetical protein
MKTNILIAAFALAVPLMAQQATQTAPPAAQPAGQPAQPASQQLTGHVLSAETHSSASTTSVRNSSTGQWSHGVTSSEERDTEIQVGNLVYECGRIHKEVQVGKDYPVTIETDKHGAAKKLTVVAGEKSYTYRITGTREVKPN